MNCTPKFLLHLEVMRTHENCSSNGLLMPALMSTEVMRDMLAGRVLGAVKAV
jgi:hypothetical protein